MYDLSTKFFCNKERENRSAYDIAYETGAQRPE